MDTALCLLIRHPLDSDRVLHRHQPSNVKRDTGDNHIALPTPDNACDASYTHCTLCPLNLPRSMQATSVEMDRQVLKQRQPALSLTAAVCSVSVHAIQSPIVCSDGAGLRFHYDHVM